MSNKVELTNGYFAEAISYRIIAGTWTYVGRIFKGDYEIVWVSDKWFENEDAALAAAVDHADYLSTFGEVQQLDLLSTRH